MNLPHFLRKLFRIPDPSLTSFVELKYGRIPNRGFDYSKTFDETASWLQTLPREVLTNTYIQLFKKGWIATPNPDRCHAREIALVSLHTQKPHGAKILMKELIKHHE
jgi:hypothetical protein